MSTDLSARINGFEWLTRQQRKCLSQEDVATSATVLNVVCLIKYFKLHQLHPSNYRLYAMVPTVYPWVLRLDYFLFIRGNRNGSHGRARSGEPTFLSILIDFRISATFPSGRLFDNLKALNEVKAGWKESLSSHSHNVFFIGFPERITTVSDGVLFNKKKNK